MDYEAGTCSGASRDEMGLISFMSMNLVLDMNHKIIFFTNANLPRTPRIHVARAGERHFEIRPRLTWQAVVFSLSA